ncbi:ran-binding protein 10-like [Sabethes cyaneus]|uniref:ran-binding protein 10-like n=1 Tax=Sabethes cyaneus TaxID=53552 RepID=UPI00237E8A8D|nr:ran-binding protein 10-like [Sabethes cyaneus]
MELYIEYEAKIISKDRDGYIGVRVTAHPHFKMNQLPIREKQTEYHGDNGNSFCSSSDGQLYGSTFTNVGLQTPDEMVDAEFGQELGQEPFKFDIEDMLREMRAAIDTTIYSSPLSDDQTDWTVILHEIVS